MKTFIIYDKYNENINNAITIEALNPKDAAIKWGNIKDKNNYFNYRKYENAAHANVLDNSGKFIAEFYIHMKFIPKCFVKKIK